MTTSTTTKKAKKKKKEKHQDDIIESILEHQDELLDEKYIPIIANAMRHIPFDVIDTIASDRNVRFFTVTDQFYAVTKTLTDPFGAIPPEKRGVTSSGSLQLIMINDIEMNKLNPEDKQTVIAHELAHVYLEHDNTPSNEKNKDFEQEANDLIRSWGFKPNIKPKTRNTKMARSQSQ